MVFWVVTSCSDVVGYQRFGRPWYLHLRGEEWGSMVSCHITMWCRNPEDSALNLHSRENLKSHNEQFRSFLTRDLRFSRRWRFKSMSSELWRSVVSQPRRPRPETKFTCLDWSIKFALIIMHFLSRLSELCLVNSAALPLVSRNPLNISGACSSDHAVWGAYDLELLEHWDCGFESRSRHGCTRVYPKVSGLAVRSEKCKWCSSIPLGAAVWLFYESV